MNFTDRKRGIRVRSLRYPSGRRSLPALLLSPAGGAKDAPGVLWLHGGGYCTGMKEMALFSRAADLVTRFGAVVLSPGYRLSPFAPYPAALEDARCALHHLRRHAAEWGIREDQLMVGGESAGGGLAAALCIRERDEGGVRIAFQMPLYPMLDDRDTETSRDNSAPVWNTRRNHRAWKLYLRSSDRASLSPYAAPARLQDFSGLPPAYTFVCEGEPFLAETRDYVDRLRAAGVPAEMKIYPGSRHAFDLLFPREEVSREAAEDFCRAFARAKNRCFAAQDEG